MQERFSAHVMMFFVSLIRFSVSDLSNFFLTTLQLVYSMKDLLFSLCLCIPSLWVSLTMWEDENLWDLVTAQLWVAEQHPHLLKIDAALTENISPSCTSHWSLLTWCISAFVRWCFWTGKSLQGCVAEEDDLKKMLEDSGFREPLNHLLQKHFECELQSFFVFFFALLLIQSVNCKASYSWAQRGHSFLVFRYSITLPCCSTNWS